MKRSITLAHLDVVAAISAHIVANGGSAVEEVQFHLDNEGQITAVAIEGEIKATRGSRTADTSADQKDAEPATGRSRSRSKPAEEETVAEEAPAGRSRSRRGAAAEETAEAEAPATTRGSRSRGAKTTEPAKPTLSEKAEEAYTVGEAEESDNVATYWVSKDDASDVFIVPAEQYLPDAELYDEIGSEEEAQAALEAANKPAEEEEAPASTGRGTRSRRGATEAAAEEAPATGRRSRGAAAPAKEEEAEAAPAGRTRRRLMK